MKDTQKFILYSLADWVNNFEINWAWPNVRISGLQMFNHIQASVHICCVKKQINVCVCVCVCVYSVVCVFYTHKFCAIGIIEFCGMNVFDSNWKILKYFKKQILKLHCNSWNSWNAHVQKNGCHSDIAVQGSGQGIRLWGQNMIKRLVCINS